MENAGWPSYHYAAASASAAAAAGDVVVSGRGQSYTYNGNRMYATSNEVSSSSWGLSDPELKRRKRIARYKVYTVEGRVKASIRNGFRWIKNKCSEIIHGY